MANPFTEATPKPLEPERHRPLSEAELVKVCSTATGELRTLLALGLYCGFRVADACLVRWEEIDLPGRVIVRTPRKTRRTGKTVAIPIHTTLAAILDETPLPDRAGYVLPGFAERYKRDNGSAVAKAVHDHFTMCGLATSEKVDGRMRAAARATFHSMRHTLVSALARQGTPLAVVRELVGHTSEAVQRAYLHVTADDVGRAMRALPAMGEEGTVPAARAQLAAVVAGFDEATAAKALKALARARLVKKG
jgi:integrase